MSTHHIYLIEFTKMAKLDANDDWKIVPNILASVPADDAEKVIAIHAVCNKFRELMIEEFKLIGKDYAKEWGKKRVTVSAVDDADALVKSFTKI